MIKFRACFATANCLIVKFYVFGRVYVLFCFLTLVYLLNGFNSVIMTTSTFNLLEELKSFQSRLFEIDLDESTSQEQLKVILNDYIHHNHFEVFCEEYVIAGFDVALVRKKNL